MSNDLRNDFRPPERDDDSDEEQKRSNFFRRFLKIPRLADWIAMSFAIAAAFLELFRNISKSASQIEILDTGIVASAFVGLLLFVFIEFEAVLRLSRKNEVAVQAANRFRDERNEERQKREQTEIELTTERQNRKAISKVFTSLASDREKFRSALLSNMALGQIADNQRAAVLDELRDRLQEFLRVLGDAAVDVLTFVKAPPSELHVNLKLLETYQDSPDTRYRVAARSRNPDIDRVLDDDRRKEPHRLSDNAIYQHIIIKRGTTDFHLVKDIDALLAGWANECHFPEPHPSVAPRFYRSGLAVAIQGPRSAMLEQLKLPDRKVTEPLGDDKVLLGFVCIDCKAMDMFDDDWDLAVMRQIAGEAYDAVRLYYVASAMCGPSPSVRLVPQTKN